MMKKTRIYDQGLALSLLLISCMSCDLVQGQPVYETVEVFPLEVPSIKSYGNVVIRTNTKIMVAACKDNTLGDEAGLVYLATVRGSFKLSAADGAAGDQFGYAVDADPETDSGDDFPYYVVTGSPFHDDMGESSGAAYLFNSSGEQLVEYLPSDGQPGDRFGISVSLGSEVGDGVVAIGAMSDDGGEEAGAVYIFDMFSGDELMKIVPEELGPFSEFGYSMEIDGSILAVGAPGDTGVGVSSGAVYVFDLETGDQLQRFYPSDGTAGDRFGHSVEVVPSNGLVVIGSINHEVKGVRSGAVYAFNYGTGSLSNKFYPPDASDGQQFGWSVSGVFLGLVVGAPGDNEMGIDAGAVYAYNQPSGIKFREKFTLAIGNERARYGHSVSMFSQDRFSVGAPDSNILGPMAGYVEGYVLDILPTGFATVMSDRIGRYGYGFRVAIDGGLAAVSASLFREDEADTVSVVYITDAQTGEEYFSLLPDDVVVEDSFGSAVAIGDGFVAVGASRDDDNSRDSGSVYIFEASTGELLRKIVSPVARPPASTIGVLFGQNVAIDNGVLCVSAQYAKNGDFEKSGLVFLFDLDTGDLLHQLGPVNPFGEQRFGTNLAMGDGVVGVVSFDNASPGRGGSSGPFEVHLFDQETGVFITKFTSEDERVPSGVGFGLSINGGAVAMSSSNSSKYVYDLQSFELLHEFSIPNAVGEFAFNKGIALDGDTLYVVQRSFHSTLDSDTVYMFNIVNGDIVANLDRSDSAVGEGGIISLAVSDGVVMTGTPSHNPYGGIGGTGLASRGAVYIYDVNEITCPADLTGDRIVNFFDISAFLLAFTTGDPSGDFNGDGAYNFFDVSAFLIAFSANCF
jgi:FG-GAP repeat